MKKVSLITMVLFVASFVPLNFAFSAGERTGEGRIEVGGDFYFTYGSYKATSTTAVAVTPRIGWFGVPHLAMEPKFLVLFQNISPPGAGEDSSITDYGLILNTAYHFEWRAESAIVPFIFAGIGFINHSGDVGEADEPSMILPDAGVGIKVFFTNSALLRAELFYEHISNAYGEKDREVDGGGLRAGMSIFVK